MPVPLSKRSILLALVNASGCLLVYKLVLFAENNPSSLVEDGLLWISSFFILLCSFYYFFDYLISKRIRELGEKIRLRFLGNEIAINSSVSSDGLSVLESRINSLIELREKERKHFENLDSYRKEYLGNVSHELKTPIFNIQGYIDTLINGGLEDEHINLDYLKRAEKSVDRMINIIDDLETITQLETGDMVLDFEVFDLIALCKDIFAALELNASRKNIQLELNRKNDRPVLVKADKFRIRQVLVNLISNSIKYGKQDGATTVNFINEGTELLVEVADNGMGIDERHLPRIFERFYRVDKGRSREQGGTGLGLAIVKHIIEAHKKQIRAESAPGKGTKFIFSLDTSY
jgi:two-component system phosphate regulon sensor histidine kinase PhoR